MEAVIRDSENYIPATLATRTGSASLASSDSPDSEGLSSSSSVRQRMNLESAQGRVTRALDIPFGRMNLESAQGRVTRALGIPFGRMNLESAQGLPNAGQSHAANMKTYPPVTMSRSHSKSTKSTSSKPGKLPHRPSAVGQTASLAKTGNMRDVPPCNPDENNDWKTIFRKKGKEYQCLLDRYQIDGTNTRGAQKAHLIPHAPNIFWFYR